MKRIILLILFILTCFPYFAEAKKINHEDIKKYWLKKDFNSLMKYSEKRLKNNSEDAVGLLILIDLMVISNRNLDEIKPYKERLFNILEKESDSFIRKLFRLYRANIELLFSLSDEEQMKYRQRWIGILSDIAPSYPLTKILLENEERKKKTKKPSINLVALWKAKKNNDILRWIKKQSPKNIISSLIILDLSIAKGEDVNKIEANFNYIKELIDKNRKSFRDFEEELNPVLRLYPMVICEMKRNKNNRIDFMKSWDNRDIIPPAIILAQKLLDFGFTLPLNKNKQ